MQLYLLASCQFQIQDWYKNNNNPAPDDVEPYWEFVGHSSFGLLHKGSVHTVARIVLPLPGQHFLLKSCEIFCGFDSK